MKASIQSTYGTVTSLLMKQCPYICYLWHVAISSVTGAVLMRHKQMKEAPLALSLRVKAHTHLFRYRRVLQCSMLIGEETLWM